MFLILSLLLAGCTIKQGQLVVIKDDPAKDKTNPDKSVYEHLDFKPRRYPIEKYKEALRHLDADMVPLAVSPDYRTVFAFEYTGNPEADTINRNTVIGNMVQEISLYAVNTENGEKKNLGKFSSIRDFRFDETGKLLAFIDSRSNIYVYSIASEQIQKIISGEKIDSYNSISWSRDSKKLMINTRMEFDIASREFISIAVDSYTPFIKSKLAENSYIAQMKNSDYNDMIALYDSARNSYTSIANGIYNDTDGINLIYTRDYMYNLNIVDLQTLESKTIENGPIYCAYIMKSTGEILYTTLNSDPDSRFRYVLVKVNPDTMIKTSAKLNSPTFYLSPAEDKVYFVGNYAENSMVADTEDLRTYQTELKNDDKDLFEIKTVLLKMFLLDYKFNDSYEKYEEKAKEIYVNTIAPVPQEALENKLIDFKRFNTTLPALQREAHIPSTISFDSISILGNKASVNLGFFYTNSVELVKLSDKWYITGFSTHPASKEIEDIKAIVERHLSNIKQKNMDEALKYWVVKEDTEFHATQRKIVEELIKNADKYTFSVGEIEFWAMSDPHRTDNPDKATYAKVKILIKEGKNTVKYKLILSRNYKKQFEIQSWNTDPLSISQLF